MTSELASRISPARRTTNPTGVRPLRRPHIVERCLAPVLLLGVVLVLVVLGLVAALCAVLLIQVIAAPKAVVKAKPGEGEV